MTPTFQSGKHQKLKTTYAQRQPLYLVHHGRHYTQNGYSK